MKALAAAVLVTLTLATPAAAETVVARAPAVGPVLAGDAVAWGEQTARGASLVMQGAPGREPVLVHRVRPATARKTERLFAGGSSAFDASAEAFAALVSTETVTEQGFDFVGIAVTEGAVAGPWHGPVGIVAGCIPRRGDNGCGPPCGMATGVAVDGSRIASAAMTWNCEPSNDPWTIAITVRDGARVTTVPVGAVQSIGRISLAGRYLAWTESSFRARDSLVIHDLETGTEVLRLRAADLGERFMSSVAMQPDGTGAVRIGDRLGVIALGTPGVRTLDRHIGGQVAVAGGRVLYDRTTDEHHRRSELVVRSLAGGPRRVLARFTERRQRVGSFDLDATRAVWAVQRAKRGEGDPSGPGRIVLQSL